MTTDMNELVSTPKKRGYTKYNPEYCDLLQRHMSKGYSFEAFGCDIGVDRKTLYNWCVAYPDFKEAKDIGTEASRKKLEGLLLRVAKTGKGNVIASIFLLKNKFPQDWRDKRELDVQKEDVRETLTLDEQLERVEAMRGHLLSLKSGQNIN